MSDKKQRRSNTGQCSIPEFSVDPFTVAATPEEAKAYAEELCRDFDFRAELESEIRLQRFRALEECIRFEQAEDADEGAEL